MKDQLYNIVDDFDNVIDDNVAMTLEDAEIVLTKLLNEDADAYLQQYEE